VEETEKQYYTRRGNEERHRSRAAGSTYAQAIHAELADLYHERANGSTNVNKRSGIRPGRGAEE
jgi:hypothetical protein